MGLTGDFGKLEELQEAMRRAGSEGAAYAARRAGKEVEKMARGQFRRAESPEGQPWAPRKADGAKPLASLVAALVVRVEGSRVTASFPSKPHAAYHEHGTRTVPKREFLPPLDKPLPERWQRRINGAVRWAMYHVIKRQKLDLQHFLRGEDLEEGAVVTERTQRARKPTARQLAAAAKKRAKARAKLIKRVKRSVKLGLRQARGTAAKAGKRAVRTGRKAQRAAARAKAQAVKRVKKALGIKRPRKPRVKKKEG